MMARNPDRDHQLAKEQEGDYQAELKRARDLSLEELVAKSKDAVSRMTDAEYDAMIEAQKASWVRGMMAKCEHGELDFEQCPKCRGWE